MNDPHVAMSVSTSPDGHPEIRAILVQPDHRIGLDDSVISKTHGSNGRVVMVTEVEDQERFISVEYKPAPGIFTSPASEFRSMSTDGRIWEWRP